MKKLFIPLISILILASCNSSTSFEKVECEPEGGGYSVFKPCREYVFNARFWSAESELISEDKIWMMATGKPWEFQPESQKELAIQYEYDTSEVGQIVKASINQEIVSQPWERKEVTGIIENENRIWMHPFRSNQYAFTEVAPFPEVALPLEIGKTWGSSLQIYEGWGEWANSTLNKEYEIVDFEQLEIPYGQLEAWHISSITFAPFGNSTHNFWFHHELGFVKMVIHNYAGQTLEIELLEVID